MPSLTTFLSRMRAAIIAGVIAVAAVICQVCPAAAQSPAPIPEQQRHGALLLGAICGGGFILVVGLMRWYGRRQARHRQQQSESETPWDRIQQHLDKTDSEDNDPG